MPTKPSKSRTAQRSAEVAENGKVSRAQWVFDLLRRAIHTGEYKQGERILEEHIAESLGVSRTPVREALYRLEAAGLLENLSTGLVIAGLTRAQVYELYAMREVLEGTAARFAAQHAVPSEIALMRHLAAEFEKSMDNPVLLAEINRELHGAIYDAAHNRYVSRALNELQDTLALLQNTTFTVPQRAELALKEHADIIDAIESRRADEADRLARLHIGNAHMARLSMLFSQQR